MPRFFSLNYQQSTPMPVIEALFGSTGTNKKLKRYSLRAEGKVQDQWHLFYLIHNLEKLNNYLQLAA